MNKSAKYGFMLATVFAGILFLGALYNLISDPTKKRLQELELSECQN
ncbi:hypothetical protein [Ancylomarina longa]|nr:hypothetical protein [Ancylomarina longa]